MAAPPAQQQTTDINATTYVAKDMIWKAYIGKADIAAKSWNENWGFLVEEVKINFEFSYFSNLNVLCNFLGSANF